MRIETPRRRRRGVGLMPLIDVVFLLLVFFILAGSFDDTRRLPLHTDRGAGETAGPDAGRVLVRLHRDGAVDLGGVPMARAELAGRLRELGGETGAAVAVMPLEGVRTSQVVDLLDLLREAGVARAAVVPR